jgi:sigma-B regulation protein RsbU (phosphoserine phosphatase)
VRSNGDVELLQKGGYFIGLVAEADYESGYSRMKPGDVLVLYTDGLTEHSNFNEVLYGEERLQSCLKRNRHLPVTDIIEAVMKDVKDFSDGAPPRDDISLLCFKHVRS